MKVKFLLFSTVLSFLICNINAQTFVNAAPTTGLLHQYNGSFNGAGVTFCDLDNDGLDDIIFPSSQNERIKIFRNNNGQFTEVTLALNILDVLESKTVLVADIDNDGDRDLFISNLTGINRLYRNNGSVFEDITATCGILMNDSLHSSAAMFFDYNKDGLLDLYAGVYSGFGNNINYYNMLYKNTGNGTFENVSVSSGAGNLGNKILAISTIDYNNDGWEDIYIANDRRFGNTMLRNNGNGTFTDVSVITGTNLTMDAMGLSVGDFDNDNDLDIYISNGEEGNAFLRNNGNGTFTDIAADLGMSVNKICWGNNFLDYDNDGDLDLFISSSGGNPYRENMLFRNNNNGTFTRVTGSGVDNTHYLSYGNAIGDFDNNGYIDIAVLNDFEPCLLWKSSGGVNKWIKLKLEGTISNRDAVGSRIYVYRNGSRFLRTTHCGQSYCSQNSFIQTIGVGSVNVIDSIEVIFPSGIKNTVTNVSTNQTITIVESGVIGINGNTNEIPSQYMLQQNYPNPFNPSTMIEYSLPVSSQVTIKMYNILGVEVKELVNEIKSAGSYSFRLNENITSGLSSGIYYYKMTAGSFTDTKKMILIK